MNYPPEENYDHLIPVVEAEFNPMLDFLFLDYSPEGMKQYRSVTQEVVDRWYEGKLEANEASVNLRFDWELNAEEFDFQRGKDVGVMVCTQDMADLLRNGNFNHSQDALLKAFNGERFRDENVVEFKTISAKLYREYKPVKENWPTPTWEYTLFVRPYVKFG